MNFYQHNSALLSKEEKKDVILYYTGDISQKIIENLGSVIRQRLKIETSPAFMHKVFSIFIEQVQNILHYSAEKSTSIERDQNFRKGITLLGRTINNKYFLLAGNMITNSQREKLERQLKTIKKMNKTEINKQYLETLTTDIASDRLGAGVGLLEVAKRASEPLEYQFDTIDNDYSYYYLKAVINTILTKEENGYG